MLTRLIATVALAVALTATAAAAPPRAYHAPRTAYGQPDLQGFWAGVWLTPFERDEGLPLTFATKAEEQAYAAKALAEWKEGEAGGLGQGVSEWHPQFAFARVDGRLRTSWIVSPADGRLPWRPEGLARLKAGNAAAVAETADGPENRSAFERCLVGGLASANPPMLNPTVAGVKRIVQTRDEVAILSEMNHDVRIVRLEPKGAPKGRGAHPPASLRQWMGESIGHWEGQTLVVETSNFHPQEAFRGRYVLSPSARVTERFTRTGAKTLLYAYAVDDPENYTAVWKGEMPYAADPGPIYEYACHEGDRDLEIFLTAARKREAEAAAGR